MYLLIGGDVVPYGNDIEYFKNGDISKLLNGKLLDIWNKADHRIFNLETPIVNFGEKILKCGPNIKTEEECLNGILKLNPSIICLANNHIMDYGLAGLNNTLSLLEDNGLQSIGIINGKDKNQKYDVLLINQKKVAIYNVCEIEFSVATDSSEGANGYDEGEVIKDLLMLKKQCDFIIVIYHGGKEYYRYPSPLLRKRCRLMVDFGANLVLCQHSHCIGCSEVYNDSTIIYGQGNFIFNKHNNQYWNSSLLIKVSFDNKISIDYLPIIRKNIGISIPEQDEYAKILEDFQKRSDEIKDDKFLNDKYNDFSKTTIDEYLISMHGQNLFFKILLKLTKNKILNLIYSKKKLAIIQNFIECEAHRELFINGLKIRERSEKDEKQENHL